MHTITLTLTDKEAQAVAKMRRYDMIHEALIAGWQAGEWDTFAAAARAVGCSHHIARYVIRAAFPDLPRGGRVQRGGKPKHRDYSSSPEAAAKIAASKARRVDIATRWQSGEWRTLEVAGESLGVTRERVRQILVGEGVTVRRPNRVREFVKSNPNMTSREAAKALGVTKNAVTAAAKIVGVKLPQPKIATPKQDLYRSLWKRGMTATQLHRLAGDNSTGSAASFIRSQGQIALRADGTPKNGRPSNAIMAVRLATIRELAASGLTRREIAERVGMGLGALTALARSHGIAITREAAIMDRANQIAAVIEANKRRFSDPVSRQKALEALRMGREKARAARRETRSHERGCGDDTKANTHVRVLPLVCARWHRPIGSRSG